MPRFAPITSFLASSLRDTLSVVLTFLGPSWDGPHRKYRPEDHYMRGPGPKWREKHLPDRPLPAAGKSAQQRPLRKRRLERMAAPGG